MIRLEPIGEHRLGPSTGSTAHLRATHLPTIHEGRCGAIPVGSTSDSGAPVVIRRTAMAGNLRDQCSGAAGRLDVATREPFQEALGELADAAIT